MDSKKTKFNLGWTFLLATSGGMASFVFNLIEVNFNFFKVDSHHYYLFLMAVICFFLAYQVVKRMNIAKKTDSFYLTVLAVYFLLFVVIGMVIAMVLLASQPHLTL